MPTPSAVDTIPTPRVVNETQTIRVSILTRPSKVRATIDKPILTRAQTQKNVEDSLGRIRLKEYLRSARNKRARITQRHHHIHMPRRNSTERIQLIYDADTEDYLNYRQLMRDPKQNEIWARSSANEFGRLTQGSKDGRVKGTNTMRYITKNQIPKDLRKLHL
jgi:hypothetical protein